MLIKVALGVTSLCAVAFSQTVIQYIVPEALPSLPYSYGVSFPNEIKTVDVLATAGGTAFRGSGIKATESMAKDLKGQMAQALVNLDAAMKELHVTKMDVAKLDIAFVGDTYDQVEMLADQLEHYFLIRNSSREMKSPPVRSMIGKASLGDPSKLIEVRATMIDPSTKPEMIQAKGKDVPEDYGTNGRTVLVGGVTAMNRNYMVRGLNSMRTQIQTTLKNMDVVLNEAGGSRSDVKNLKIYYTPKDESEDAKDPVQAEKLLNEELKKFFGEDNAPTVTLQASAVNCAAYLNVLVDAQASIKGAKEKAVDNKKKPTI